MCITSASMSKCYQESLTRLHGLGPLEPNRRSCMHQVLSHQTSLQAQHDQTVRRPMVDGLVAL